MADVKTRVSQSVVRVRSYKSNLANQPRKRKAQTAHAGRPHYKSCPGIILEVRSNMVLVGVHHSKIDPMDLDVIRVSFFNNEVKVAEFHEERTSLMRVLRVEVSNHHFHQVIPSKNRIGHEGIFLYINQGTSNLEIHDSSVINPTTREGYTDSSSMETRNDYFTFGCPVNIRDLVGAPVFSSTGQLVGMVHNNHASVQKKDDGSGRDVVYAHHAMNFIPEVLEKVKDLEVTKKRRKVKVRRS